MSPYPDGMTPEDLDEAMAERYPDEDDDDEYEPDYEAMAEAAFERALMESDSY